jgi:Ca-activated chloride channel homolog
MFGVDFAHPWFLLLLPAALIAWWWSNVSGGRVLFSSLRALPAGQACSTWRTALAWIPDVLFALAVVGFVIALAGPQKGDRDSRIRREGIAIMMAVDCSGSMRALDLSEKNKELTRLDAVKSVFERFVLGSNQLAGRVDDAIGLVAFAHYAETRAPLTLDHGNLIAAARQLDFASEADDGTAIGAGLELAVQRLKDYKADTKVGKVIILLTDGESNVHDIDEDSAIEDAAKAGIKVYTIGAGTRGMAPFPTRDLFGNKVYRPIQVDIDEDALRQVAKTTGARYFRATDTQSLRDVYAEIDKAEKTTFEAPEYADWRELYPWLLWPALLLVCAELGLGETALRKLP